MSDPKERFIAGLGRAAEAVSGRTQPSHLGPTCDQSNRHHMWLTTEHGHDICVQCKLTRPTPLPASPDFETWWKTFIADYLPHGIEEHSAAKFAWQAVSTARASQLSDLEAALAEARDVIAASATDFIAARDALLSDPACKEHLPNAIAELGETGEWLRAYVSDAPSAIKSLADRLNKAESQLSDMEAAKNDALTLANLREAEIERLREERDEWVGIAKNEFDAALGLQKRLEQAQADAARLREALKLMVDRFGGPHDDHQCPEDDTCACPSVALVNRAIAQPPEPTDGR